MLIGLLITGVLSIQSPAVAAQQLEATAVAPTPEQVMALPEDLRTAFRKDVLERAQLPEARLEKLVAFVFDRDKLGITYSAEATQSVADSFRTRKVNCLSSTLLVVALAREAGLTAQGQQVDSILSWSSTGDLVIQSRHANAIIEVTGKRRFVIDVDASDALATNALRPISDEQLLGLFYGNRGMELMAEGRLASARAWLNEALVHAPDDAGLLNNAGVLSLRMGELPQAERDFLKAVEYDPRQFSVLSNLISYYQRLGNVERVAVWKARSDKVLQRDPYYQFKLGREQELVGDSASAIRFYRRAVSLHGDEHMFHFALARTYLGLGNFRKAYRELAAALYLSEGTDRRRYEEKLKVLRRLRR